MTTTVAPQTVLEGMAHAGWGDPSRRHGLAPHARAWLEERVGPAARAAARPLRDVALPPPRLDAAQLRALADAVGAGHVSTAHEDRVRRAAGRSYLDLLALRGDAPLAAPDAVVRPGSAAEVAAVLRACTAAAIAVVPFGGGTSVVGGVAPEAGGRAAVVSLDLGRLDRLLSVDPVALTAVLEPGVPGPRAEQLLAAHGVTLGHFPQSFEHATIGGFAATRSAGQASSGYGRFDDLVTGLVVQTPAGELRLGRGAASAAGPSLLGLLVGSEGCFGVITEVHVRVRPRPEQRRYEAFLLRSWHDGLALLRELEQSGLAPDVARLSDADETAVTLAMAGASLPARALRAVASRRGEACLAVLGWEGTPASAGDRRRAVGPALRRSGALRVPGAGARWEAGRFDGPYLRDDLLDAGYLVETLETSTTWSALEDLHLGVTSALRGSLGRAHVMCHVSHLYPHGASLYFTAVAPRDPRDPVAQWQRAKDAASAAIVARGATITHHHAVGADHRRWMTDEVGPLGVEVLRAVKGVLDPGGVLNPGKLVP